MNSSQVSAKLVELIALGRETEWVERKQAATSIDFDDLGKYSSALSNEANLHGEPWGWLILAAR